jgi:uncharacterized repeat protein (TIGR03803 family)
MTKNHICLFLSTVALSLSVCVATAIRVSAQTFTTVASFDGGNGYGPDEASVVQGLDGNFYGVTQSGGAHGSGTVFKMTPKGVLTTLHSFCSRSGCPDGANPTATLLPASSGILYGTTVNGGVTNKGTVFKITPGGTLTRLYSFCATQPCLDGGYPFGALVEGSDGNLYGTASGGFAPQTYGTVFRITPDGVLTTLYSFCSQPNCADGVSPDSGLTQASDGNFYGATPLGGNYSNCPGEAGGNGCGTIFKITPSGKLTTLYTFCPDANCPDGEGPDTALIQAKDGNFYGMTDGGGANGDYGTIFRITPTGRLTTLYSFCAQTNSQGYCTDGAEPVGLAEGPDGNFYGTAPVGGASGPSCTSGTGCGTLFRVTPRGVLTTLHSFCSDDNCTDGVFPGAAPIQATDGKFYSTTLFGGTYNSGTVFSLGMGIGPSVEALPNEGSAGRAITIIGHGLNGSTAVSFNGTAAAFNLESDTYLTATVPTGATTGIVSVTTPGGVLNSNQSFQVKP